MKKYLLLAFVIFSFINLHAQMIVPAPAQDSLIILMNGFAHLGNGQVIENSAIGFEKGKITFVADARTVRIEQSGARIIYLNGKHVYPGLIACNTDIGLSEIEAARATLDAVEVGSYNPEIRSIIAYNTDSKIIPTVRSNGILIAQVVPQGGFISGQSSVVQLDAWNWEDAQYKTDDGIHINYPAYYSYQYSDEAVNLMPNEKFAAQVNQLKQFFNEAKAYCALSKPADMNLKLEAMRGLFNGSKKLFIHANSAKEICSAVLFSKELGLKCVIVGGSESWKCTDLLFENNVPVILGRIQSLPGSEDDDYDLPYKLPSILKKAGVEFCLSMDGFWQQRNLPFLGGQSVAYSNISKEEALMLITLNAARMLGIDSYTGSIEAGKDANIIVSDGDIFDMKTSRVSFAFIQGREINLDNKQKQLYEIYKSKYGIR